MENIIELVKVVYLVVGVVFVVVTQFYMKNNNDQRIQGVLPNVFFVLFVLFFWPVGVIYKLVVGDKDGSH